MPKKARVDPKNDVASGSLVSRPKLATGARCDASGVGHSGDKMDSHEKDDDAKRRND